MKPVDEPGSASAAGVQKEASPPVVESVDEHVYRIHELGAVRPGSKEPHLYDTTYNVAFFKNVLSEQEWQEIIGTVNDLWLPAGTRTCTPCS